MIRKSPSETFTFKYESNTLVNHIASMQQQLRVLQQPILDQDNFELQELQQQYIRKNEVISLKQQDLSSLQLNSQLEQKFAAAIKTHNTLYEILTFTLLKHLYIDVTHNKIDILHEFRRLVFSDELNGQGNKINMGDIYPQQILQYSKLVLLKLVNIFDSEILSNFETKSILELEAALFNILNKYSIAFFIVPYFLRKLINKLATVYEMELEEYSVADMHKDPQLDILWLVCEFFQLNITLYSVQSKIIKEENFKVNNNYDSVFLVKNSINPNYTYLHLKQTFNLHIESVSFLSQSISKENLYNTNSEASEFRINDDIENNDTQNKVKETQLQNEQIIQTKRKTNRNYKQKHHNRKNRLKLQFEKDYNYISSQVTAVINKGEQILNRFKLLTEESQRTASPILRMSHQFSLNLYH